MTGRATDWTTLIPPLRFVAFTFVTASGLATLEVAANSYISVLGPPKTAAFRLVLAQSFNVSGTCLCHTGCEIDNTRRPRSGYRICHRTAHRFKGFLCKLSEISALDAIRD